MRRFIPRRTVVGLLLLLPCIGLPASAADGELDLSRHRGRIVLVDFWASWCGPCRQSFPWLNEMQARYGKRGLVVIGVNVDRQRVDAARFLEETPATFQIVYDPDGTIAARYDLPGMPSSYLFGPNGELLSRHIGFRASARDEREAELERLLTSALTNTPPQAK